MPRAVYQLRFLLGEVELVRQAIIAALDLEHADSAIDLLERHLRGVATRTEAQVHELLVEVFDVDRRGNARELVTRFALPYEGEAE